MIAQLIDRFANAQNPKISNEEAANRILFADPLDLFLAMDEVWRDYARLAGLATVGVGDARDFLARQGAFRGTSPVAGGASTAAAAMVWDHLGYAYVLENTRIVQIMQRVVREFRHGEALGLPSQETLRWCDATEALAFGGSGQVLGWTGISQVRPDPEASRWGYYNRLFGTKPAFAQDDGRPIPFVRSTVANTSFVPLLEELLYELWQAISNINNASGVNQSDDDRIYRIAEQLSYTMRSRRLNGQLVREELLASTVLGWFEQTVLFDNAVTKDLKATGSSPAERLRAIGDRVGLAPHSRSASFFAMAADLSTLLRTIEGSVVIGPSYSWTLYSTATHGGVTGIGAVSRRVITEWSAATGKDLKTRARPVEVDGRRLVGAGR